MVIIAHLYNYENHMAIHLWAKLCYFMTEVLQMSFQNQPLFFFINQSHFTERLN